MVGVAFHFPFGRYHATRWGTHVNESEIDWPPSPWRILRALLAAVHEAGSRPEGEDALIALARSTPPRFELPPALAAHTRHYFPLRDHKTALVIDGFMAFGDERELRAWWPVDLTPPQHEALAEGCAELRYLGRSESLCDARLLAHDEHPGPLSAWPASEDEDSRSSSPVRLLACAGDAHQPLEILSVDIGEMRRGRRTLPEGAVTVEYRVAEPSAPGTTAPPQLAKPTLAVLRIASGARPPLHDAVVLATILRGALQRRFDRASSGQTSTTFSGRNGDERRADQHRHAHYLVVPDLHSHRADRVVIWAPEGLGAQETAAIADLRRLRLRNLEEDLPVALVGLGDRENSPIPDLTGPAVTWESLTPFVLPRHLKPGRAADTVEAQLLAELGHRGLPEPATIAPTHGQWSLFARDRPGRREHRAKQAVGVRLSFDQEIEGPLALGANAHFGLGLFRPVRERDDRRRSD